VKEEMKQKNELLDLFTKRNIYAEVALSQIPRLLSLLDRKKGSKSYGSFDRNYWRYNTIDFPGASFQIAILPLAMIYTKEYPDNIYYKHHKIRDWTIAAMEFLSKIQNHDGGFNQDYPYIWSVAGVAFPTYSASEAYLLLSKELNHSSKEIIIEMLKKAGNWLLNTNDMKVANQEAGAAMALYNIYQITGEDIYRIGAESEIKRILKNQSPDGWFYEYGGGDIGYLTLCIDCLAKYYQKTGDDDLLEALKKSIDFISHFVHPNGTMGGEYASRNTEFIIPSGFEILSREIPLTSAIADSNIHALNQGLTMEPMTFDNIYLCFTLHSYLQAYDNFQPRIYNDVGLPHTKPLITKYFPHYKYIVIKRGDYYMIIGASKGGVIRIYNCKNKSDLIFSDCGFIGTLSNGKMVSNQWLDYSNEVTFNEDMCNISISGRFHEISQVLPSSTKLVLSRIGLPLISKIPFARNYLYQQLRKLMITGSSAIPIEFTRQISYKDKKISISDIVNVNKDFQFKYFNIEDKFSTIYGQAKEFFQRQELSNLKPIPEDNLAEYIKGRCNLSIVREIYPDSKELKYEIKVDNQKLRGDVK
jgi:hypothetical protein